MYTNQDLKDLFSLSSSVKSTPLVALELNMNKASNIDTYGVYKNSASVPAPSRFIPNDSYFLTYKQYLTDELFEEVTDDNYVYEYNEQKKLDLYYNLEECFKTNRPRSGINKILFRPGSYVDDLWSADRPRYYYADPTDRFKYWTSYRNYGNGLETGISNDANVIENAAPFVVFKESVPANKIVVKIQTNIGSGVPNSYADTIGEDPLQDNANSSIPAAWRIEYLNETNVWTTAAINPEVTANGYVELGYTVLAPLGYEDSFFFSGYAARLSDVGNGEVVGQAWVIGQTATDRGLLYVWSGDAWIQNPLVYGFKQQLYYDDQSSTVTKIVDPRKFTENGQTTYSEFVMVKGLRIVVSVMENPEKTFDLIEMSPRLAVEITDYVESHDVTKVTGGTDGAIPITGLLASTGSLSLFNGDGAFSKTNADSIVAKHLLPNTKVYIWEAVHFGGYKYYVPIKVLSVEQWPDATAPNETISLQLRDHFYIFESEKTVDALRQNMTLTGAVAWLMDSIGFSNYVFRGFEEPGSDPILPFFFANADINVAETLNELARATQSMMYFDEYNNFVVASKDYVFNTQRDADFEFSGQDSPLLLSNIQSLGSVNRPFFNNGTVRYTDRYIQREIATLSQASSHDKWREWTYKPVLLWEVSGTENVRTRNGPTEQQSGFALSAVTLNSDLSAAVPTVYGGRIINNVLDAGDTAFWLARYDGYLYANGEIIKYDAIEYAIPGQAEATVWIENGDQYQYYFARVPFRGKIYPTGRVRIFAEPYYDENGVIVNGVVRSHGRGMFNTPVLEHKSSIRSWWLDKANVTVVNADSSFIFNEYAYDLYKYQQSFKPITSGWATAAASANVSGTVTNWTITDTIKDMWAQYYRDEAGDWVKDPGAIKASALVFSGQTQLPAAYKQRDIMAIATKPQNDNNFVGARVRIVGKEENGLGGKSGTPLGEFSYDFQPREGSEVALSGGSCGIASFYNKTNGTGYFFEIVSFASDLNDMVIDDADDSETNASKITVTSGSNQVTVGTVSYAVPGYYIYHEAFPLGTYVVSVAGDVATMSTTANGSFTSSDAYFSKYIEGQARAIHNIVFYKLIPGQVNTAPRGTTAVWSNGVVPVKLWGGLAEVLVDSGQFVGQSRAGTATTPTVYDLGMEYFRVGSKPLFNLYINGKIVATVTDTDTAAGISGSFVVGNGDQAGMFVRGSTMAMFENFMMMKPNVIDASTETALIYGEPLAQADDMKMKNYQISPFLRTAIDGISTTTYGKYIVDYEEFGTILRECMYFNVKYDQAYPAFFSKVAPIINNAPAYHVANYRGGPYRAEFMLFNITDAPVVLDETTGNYLRILGVTFTQQNERTLGVDEYLEKIQGGYSKLFNEIMASRKEYGDRSFDFQSMYIQNYDAAKDIMRWLLDRLKTPKQEISMTTFFVPTLQLGDIITVDYAVDGVTYVDSSKQMVVTEIKVNRSSDGPTMQISAVER